MPTLHDKYNTCLQYMINTIHDKYNTCLQYMINTIHAYNTWKERDKERSWKHYQQDKWPLHICHFCQFARCIGQKSFAFVMFFCGIWWKSFTSGRGASVLTAADETHLCHVCLFVCCGGRLSPFKEETVLLPAFTWGLLALTLFPS